MRPISFRFLDTVNLTTVFAGTQTAQLLLLFEGLAQRDGYERLLAMAYTLGLLVQAEEAALAEAAQRQAEEEARAKVEAEERAKREAEEARVAAEAPKVEPVAEAPATVT